MAMSPEDELRFQRMLNKRLWELKYGQRVDNFINNIDRYISKYENAMTLGKFKKAAKMVNPKPSFDKETGMYLYDSPNVLRRGAFLKRYIQGLGKLAGESLNSPLLDLFGPVHMNEAMRKSKPRRKYLVDDEGA